jgi:hypothetical protein
VCLLIVSFEVLSTCFSFTDKLYSSLFPRALLAVSPSYHRVKHNPQPLRRTYLSYNGSFFFARSTLESQISSEKGEIIWSLPLSTSGFKSSGILLYILFANTVIIGCSLWQENEKHPSLSHYEIH